MSLFTSFALGAAQGAAQGLAHGATAQMQMDMEQAKEKIREARERTMMKLQQDFTLERDKATQEFTTSRDDARFEQQSKIEQEKTLRQQADLELKERIANARDQRERDIAEQRHKQALAAIGAREQKTRGIYDTTADGEKIYIEGTTATKVLDADGKPVKTLKNMSETDKADARTIATEIQTLMRNPPISKAEKPAYEARLQELRRQQASMTGRPMAQPALSSDDFLNSVLGTKR